MELAPFLDLGGAADVVEGDALIFIEEEHRQLAGVDDLLDLVLALLVVDGLGHQPVAFVHDQGVVEALRASHEARRAAEEGVVFPLLQRTGELGAVHRPRCRVLAHVAGIEAHPQQPGQQVHRHHRFPRAGPALHQQHAVPPLPQLPCQGQGLLEHHFLLIDQHELGVALEHPLHRIGELLARLGLAVADPLDRAAPVAHLQAAAQEGGHGGVVVAQEQRRLLQIGPVAGVADAAAIGAVVQVGAGLQRDPVLHHGSVEPAQQGAVAHRLVRGVGGVPRTLAQERAHHPIQLGGFHRFPLLQLHDHRRRRTLGVVAGEQQVDPLGGVVDPVFDCHPQLPGNRLELQHVTHTLQRVLPGPEFIGRHLVARAGDVAFADLFLDAQLAHMLEKLLPGGEIDDHWGSGRIGGVWGDSGAGGTTRLSSG